MIQSWPRKYTFEGSLLLGGGGGGGGCYFWTSFSSFWKLTLLSNGRYYRSSTKLYSCKFVIDLFWVLIFERQTLNILMDWWELSSNRIFRPSLRIFAWRYVDSTAIVNRFVIERLNNEDGNLNENVVKQCCGIQSLHVRMQPPGHFSAVVFRNRTWKVRKSQLSSFVENVNVRVRTISIFVQL